MCGVVGIFAYHPDAPKVDGEELINIRDHMASRGPDGEGEWYSNDRRVGLGHRRLSIIDLSDNAAQPMSTEDGQLVISFNGEIYNYQSIRNELEQRGYRFRTHSDTEVLLHLYADKGEAMVHDLRGMFAFALWDKKKHAMLLVRDPYGIKPLYYADDDQTLRVASQVKAIMAGGKVSRQSETAGIVGFYLFGSVPEPYTIYKGIRSVPAGSYLWVNSTGPTKPVQYFLISDILAEGEQEKLNEADIQTYIRGALLDSVKHHMVSDVPVGAFLSAGIDSGALVGLMSELSKETQQFRTICLAFEEFKGQHSDESILAAKVAEHYGTKHTTRYVTEEEFQQELPKIMEAMDQPTIDGINTWFVAKAAKEQGLKVAISGVGGDELFGGYPSFKDIPNWVRLMWLPSHIPGFGMIMEQIQEAFEPLFSGINPKVKGMVRYGGTFPGAYMLRRGLFLPRELSKLLGREITEEGLHKLRPLKYIENILEPTPPTNYGKVLAMESGIYMRNQLLRDTDWTGMAHSLEVRMPLVDAWLLRKLANTLAECESPNHKKFLAKCPSKSLPSEVVSRTKSGFTTPIANWQQRVDTIKDWRKRELLSGNTCPWARRWAYSVMNYS